VETLLGGWVSSDRGQVVTDLTERYSSAVHYAVVVHGPQKRKGTSVPYLAHLLGVSSLVLEAGGDEDLAIAALLHDAAEDHGGEARLRDVSLRFGDRVAAIVRECSDSLSPADVRKEDWETRKREHLFRLRSASDDTLVVWTADKVHNCRAITTDLRVHGAAVLVTFNGTPAQILWCYRENLELAEDRSVCRSLLLPLRDAVGQLADLIG
jgi:(p)ppGpp synthase/HD superfamily hydrolase